MRLEGKSLRSDYARFVTPTILSLMVFSLYSMVDGIFVSRGVSETAMAAVNLSIPFINFLFSVTILMAVGTSTILAIYLGQGKKKEADDLFSQNLLVGAALGVVITVLALVFTEPLARLLGASGQMVPMVVDYIRGVAPFSVFFIVSYTLEVLVKTDGYPRLATIAVTVGCLLNCVLDYAAIFWWGWGIWGAAWATGFSQLAVSCIYIYHFLKGKTTFHIHRFHFDGGIYRRLLPLGVSDGLTELCTGLMIFLFNRTILWRIGKDGLVSYTVIAYVNTLVVMTMVGVSQGMQPLVSYHYGKQEPLKCKTLLRYALITGGVISALGFAGLYAFAPQVVSAFLKQGSALFDTSVILFRRFSFSFLLVGFNVVLSGFLTAVERPKDAITVSMGRGLVVQSACLLLLAVVFGGAGIWYTTLLSESIVLIVSVFFLRRYLKTVEV